MSKVLVAPSGGIGYNGTHGNLSAQHVAVPALGDGDSLVAFKLEAGIKLVELKVLCAGDAVANLTATASLSKVSLGDIKHETAIGAKLADVIGTATAVPKGVLSSDSAGYAPKRGDTQEDKYLVVTFAGAAVPKDKLTLAAYTTSEGTI